MIREPAPAKLNLALHVRRLRPDGYHDIDTLFAFCSDGDLIEIEPAPGNRFTITGPYAAALGSDPAEPWADNLVTRAADAFTETFPAPPFVSSEVEKRGPGDHPDVSRPDPTPTGNGRAYRITLTKNLPVASGIGGGSADAAATFRALARMHGVPLDDPELYDIAARLGADVPACLLGRTALGRGRGDELRPVPGLPGAPVLLVNPGVPISTAAVFAAWDGVDRGPVREGPLLEIARAGRNDLEPPALALAPAIGEVLTVLTNAPGVLLARMSGSGATCFALFADEPARDAAAAAIAPRGWWTMATALT